VAAILVLSGKSRRFGVGLVFGSTITMVSTFIEESVATYLGGALVAVSVISTLAALVAAVSSIVYFAPELRWANMRDPLTAAYCLAALGFVAAVNPGEAQYQIGPHWVTLPGYVGPGVTGRYLFAGIIAIATLILPAVIAGLLPGTGGRAGLITGWLVVNLAAGIDATVLATEPGERAAPALYASWIVWAIALTLGVVLLVRDRGLRPANAQPTLAGRPAA
jgi:hypothetical protein